MVDYHRRSPHLRAAYVRHDPPWGIMLSPSFIKGVPRQRLHECFMDWHLIYRDHADIAAIGRRPAASGGHRVPHHDDYDADHLPAGHEGKLEP